MSMAPMISQVAMLVITMDLRIYVLLQQPLNTKSTEDKIIISTLNNIDLNITVLSNGFLHAPHTGVTMVLRAQEQCALSLITKYSVNNEKMFTRNMKALKEIDMI